MRNVQRPVGKVSRVVVNEAGGREPVSCRCGVATAIDQKVATATERGA